MTCEQEEAVLAPYLEKAEKGEIVSVAEIAHQTAVGHTISPTHIYAVLKRHDWRKVMPRSRSPRKASEEAIEAPKKINAQVQELKELSTAGNVRLMFQDEVGFGRINKPKYCWCRRHLTERSLPSHPRIPLCLRRRRAAYGRKPLSDHAQLRYRLYECLPAGTLAKILGRSDPALLRRRRLAQVQDA